MTLSAAEAHYEERARLSALTSRRAAQLWDNVDPNNIDSWQRLIPEMSATVTAAQYRAASTADDYVAAALDEQGIDIDAEGSVNPEAFVGTASDGRSLTSLLDQPRIATLLAIADGLDVLDALTRGRSQLQTIAATQVQDIGRAADSVAMYTRLRVGYVRLVNAPCCSRCAILAGKFFRSNQGFQRHPRCDCIHIPTTHDLGRDAGTNPEALVASGKVQGLNRAELDAIAEGADLNQVVNARRGRRGMTTSEGTTRFGSAGNRLQGRRRLTPEAIYRTAVDREDALRLLEEHGYLYLARTAPTASAATRQTVESAATFEVKDFGDHHIVKRIAPDGTTTFAEVRGVSGWSPDDPMMREMLEASAKVDPTVRLVFTDKAGNDPAWVNMNLSGGRWQTGRRPQDEININRREIWTEEAWAGRPDGHFVKESGEVSMPEYVMAHEHGHVIHARNYELTPQVQEALAAIVNRPGVFDAEHFGMDNRRMKSSLTMTLDFGMSRYGTQNIFEAVAEAHAAWWHAGRSLDGLADRPALAAIAHAMGWT